MYQQLLIADCVIDVASEASARYRVALPFLIVEFATELDEPFVYATMEAASE